MKKILILLLLGLGVIGFSRTKQAYSIRCKSCKAYYEKTRTGCTGCNSWRDFTVPHKKENGKTYTLYRCSHGCAYWVELED